MGVGPDVLSGSEANDLVDEVIKNTQGDKENQYMQPQDLHCTTFVSQGRDVSDVQQVEGHYLVIDDQYGNCLCPIGIVWMLHHYGVRGLAVRAIDKSVSSSDDNFVAHTRLDISLPRR